MGIERATLRVTNIPLSAVAEDLLDFFESKLGVYSVFAIEIFTAHKNCKSHGSGRVQFATIEARSKVQRLSEDDDLIFKSHPLELSTKTPDDFDINDIVERPIRADLRLEDGALHAGFMTTDDCLHVLKRWDGVRGWIMPDRKRLEFWVGSDGETCMLELLFDDILETVGCGFNGSGCNALLFRVCFFFLSSLLLMGFLMAKSVKRTLIALVIYQISDLPDSVLSHILSFQIGMPWFCCWGRKGGGMKD